MANTHYTLDGNEGAAQVAYNCTDSSFIFPITPSSTMGELADEWAAKGKKNIWGHVPQVVEMQSEGGAAGALHGALQVGVIATTYTASQGLLLMIPNMYKIAGELTPCVMHVTARSLATSALSIFGDHGDVMSVRSTGWAMLCSGSVQEAHDMAMVAHSATLEASIPFVHFFDGFRTSHEVNKIEVLSADQMRQMINDEKVLAHRNRGLNPDRPFIRGTAQNPDVCFQGRERANPFYAKVPEIVEQTMVKLAKVTGREYHLFEYMGHPNAERIIIIMGSGSTTVRETIKHLVEKGEKVGAVQIHLFRPFSVSHFIKAIPESVKAIAVLDRTKEPTGIGEPLYQDVISAFAETGRKQPTIIGGRYGISSKEFTPAMVKAVFDELSKKSPKNHFTVGINDDVTHTSLDYDPHFHVESERNVRALFFGLGADGTVGANKNSIKIIGEETDFYAQGYFVYDSKKSGSRTTSHLRFGPDPILSSYLIQSANFIGVHQFNFLEKIDVLGKAAPGAVFLLNSVYGPEEVFAHLPKPVQEELIKKNIAFYVIDAYKVAEETGMGNRINTIMQTCFFAISGVLPKDEAIKKIKEAIQKTYAKKGADVVQKNFEAVDKTLNHLHRVKLPSSVTANAKSLAPVVSAKAPTFVKDVLGLMMADRGDEIPVSQMPTDGTFPSGTTQWEKRNISAHVAHWDPSLCIQCGRCSMVCPHAVIRAKRYDAALLKDAPAGFPCAAPKMKGFEDKKITLQVYLEDCTGCGLCYEACPAKSKTEANKKAMSMAEKAPILETEKKNIEFFETLPYTDRTVVDKGAVNSVQYLQPLFEFSGACAGCGETPYVKMISQLFGDRLLVANATGCSSIYGGNLPTTPWSKNQDGRGPAWSNSLFEDNAEFGLGFSASHELLRKHAIQYTQELQSEIGEELAKAVVDHALDTDEKDIASQRERLNQMKERLQKSKDPRAKHLVSIMDNLVKRSIWILGGDGWAYDIGFGGLDHVLATGRNVKVMVLDTEVYSNTGGQSSKSTPLGAVAKFAAGGKVTPKKDLGLMMMSYGYVYVAHIAMGANMAQALKAVTEAEAYPGPALVIAYSHCIAHGIDMQRGMQEQKNAVDSGCWPLYRYNPLRAQQGQNPFVLDSSAPTLPLKDYVYNEVRFKTLLQSQPEMAKTYLEQAEKEISHRFKIYQEMAKEVAK